ncbi:MAG: GNAT family N-acetyltransferase [Ruminococcaceae bacterium]|nr:GNAT family N-acetyltransferase [Oscillospiraceae bacterium]
MHIRKATEKDIPRLIDLLYQVHRVHSQGRPDIFRAGNKKYTEDELREILSDETKPIYAAADETDTLCGYAFCIYEEIKDQISLMDRKSLYIDDLCVDENMRGKHIGTQLYEHVLEEAKKLGCYHVTLNVWCLNESAMRFYEKCGLSPLKITMEQILK